MDVMPEKNCGIQRTPVSSPASKERGKWRRGDGFERGKAGGLAVEMVEASAFMRRKSNPGRPMEQSAGEPSLYSDDSDK